MNKKLVASLFFFVTAATTYPDGTCVWETTVPDLETNVSENGPLRFTGCACNCAQYQWHQGTICHVCNHAHAGARTLGNKQFTFKQFLTPEWLESLATYVEKKNASQVKILKLANYSENNNYYETPTDQSNTPALPTGGGPLDDGGSSGNSNQPFTYDGYNVDETDFYEGQSTTTQAFDGPSIGSGDTDLTEGLNFGI